MEYSRHLTQIAKRLYGDSRPEHRFLYTTSLTIVHNIDQLSWIAANSLNLLIQLRHVAFSVFVVAKIAFHGREREGTELRSCIIARVVGTVSVDVYT